MEDLEKIAEKIAKKFNLDKDALLNKNENIFYFLNGNSIIEVDRKTHLSKYIKLSFFEYELVKALYNLNEYLKEYDFKEI